jgi:hypothetical protein
MRLFSWFAVPAALLLWAGAAGAGGLDKVDRTIKKEPAYRAKPKYCLLVFGREARHRVWLVLDGDLLYVDKNGNSDLTKGECIKAPAFQRANIEAVIEQERTIKVGDLAVGGCRHTDLVVTQSQYRRKHEKWQEFLDSTWRHVPDGVVYLVSIKLDPKCYGLFGEKEREPVLHFASSDNNGPLAFADRPQSAPVLHFGGPLTLRLLPGRTLCRGQKSEELHVCVGSRGLGPGNFANMFYDLVPEKTFPLIEVQFPAKEPAQPPVTRKQFLERRC